MNRVHDIKHILVTRMAAIDHKGLGGGLIDHLFESMEGRGGGVECMDLALRWLEALFVRSCAPSVTSHLHNQGSMSEVVDVEFLGGSEYEDSWLDLANRLR